MADEKGKIPYRIFMTYHAPKGKKLNRYEVRCGKDATPEWLKPSFYLSAESPQKADDKFWRWIREMCRRGGERTDEKILSSANPRGRKSKSKGY